eukprot:INCI9769.1.p1 GENE.INCI9769.1~~INCI9769.1.p1  ORF type:complete len:102 (+),score=15.81 INCI9769.1:226-531(+)
MQTPPFRKRRLPTANAQRSSGVRNASWKIRVENEKDFFSIDAQMRRVLQKDSFYESCVADSKQVLQKDAAALLHATLSDIPEDPWMTFEPNADVNFSEVSL